ncbi:MAG: peptide deformylase [Patescibacteria group bacterium]|jgi:peptide deformylase|nr:peptide deformylase [Patescibacteria group bacterium]
MNKEKNNNKENFLDIIHHPDERLRKISDEVDLKDIKKPEFQNWLQDLKLTMIKKDGAGLAAPQVGKNIRVFVVNDEKNNIILINPKITKKSWARELDDEGCLSVVNTKGELVYGPVSRHKKINCSYIDENGNPKKIKVDKFLARVIQHENDHLNGILFIDHISSPLPDLPDNVEESQNN